MSIAVERISKKSVKAIVCMPLQLYGEARKLVDRKLVPADNINDFFVAAICAYVKSLRREQIDSNFANMAEDADDQEEARLIEAEFSLRNRAEI